ncbi:hypothetical protein [Streptosporangium sp. H16]|uniref:hypothetical protein n=1 Tax=Streptosporangium sp. H16 TaxID=3444184 RepID=UPI003F799AEB
MRYAKPQNTGTEPVLVVFVSRQERPGVSGLPAMADDGEPLRKMAQRMEISPHFSSTTPYDPLSVAYFASCHDGPGRFTAALSATATESAVDIGPGLRGVRRSAPDSPSPVVGVHNPTETVQEFVAHPLFPEVVAGRAHLVFVSGHVETVGAPGEPPRFRLRPGAHVWLAQASDSGSAGAPHRSHSAAREHTSVHS